MRFFILLIFWTSFALNGQCLKLQYLYDNVGNQTVRQQKTNDCSRKGVDTVAVKSAEKSYSITLYPNPVTYSLRVEASGLPADTTWGYDIIDMNGNIKVKRSVHLNKDDADLTILPAGAYIMTCTIRNEKKRFKLIKE